jgi:tol-pal system protein YbgF
VKPSARAALLTILAALLGMGSACVLPDQLTKVQSDVADLQQQMGEVRRSQEATRDEIAELNAVAAGGGAENEVTREDMAEVALRLDRVSREATMTDEKVNDLGRRLDRFAQEIQQSRQMARSETGTPENFGTADPAGGSGTSGATLQPMVRPSSAVPDPEALYNTAYLDFSKGNFDLAIAGFEEYQQRFAESPLADNALYWIGECQFSKGDFAAAILAFDRLLEGYARSDKAPAADLKKALAFQEQNQIGQAIVQLRYVISEYPDTDEARIARDKLSALGQSPG